MSYETKAKVRRLAAEGKSKAEIVRILGVSWGVVIYHLKNPGDPPGRAGRKRRVNLARLYELADQGVKSSEIARELGVSYNTVRVYIRLRASQGGPRCRS